MKLRHQIPRELPTLALIGIISLFMALFVPAFREPGNLTAVGQAAAFIGILACGEALVILGAGLDLSVGSILPLAGCATAIAIASGVPWQVALLIGVAVGGVAGLINGGLITDRLAFPYIRRFFKRFTSEQHRPPIMVTLATFLLFRYGTAMMTKSSSYGAFDRSAPAYYEMGQGQLPFVIFILTTMALALLTQKARIGRWIVAMGGSEQAAKLSGIPVAITKQTTYLISGLCAGLTGVLLTASVNHIQWDTGKGAELDAIAACVVGGVRITGGEGSITGAALGAVLIALLQNVMVLTGRPKEQYGLFTGGVILVAAVLEQWRISRRARQAAKA